MDYTTKLLESLIKNFSIDKLSGFFRHKNYEVFKHPKLLTSHQRFCGFEREKFSEIYEIGYLENDHTRIDVFCIKTDEIITDRTSKKKQHRIAKDILKDRMVDAGIFVFFDNEGNFRFSFVFTEYEFTRAKFSHYKRYTYFVSKNKPYRTFLENVAKCSFKSIEDIKEAFSLQPLTKEFYMEIQNWYAWAIKHSHFPGGKTEENLIRLLTRIIFVWFLKEAKLIPDIIFDENSLYNIVKDFNKADHYYNVILQNLFFATLNTYPGERKFAKEGIYIENRTDFGVKTLYRYSSKLLIKETDFLKIFERIPFINGGLFYCLDNDSLYIDGFSRREDKRAKIPDFIFFSNEREEDLSDFYGSHKICKVRGLIKILKDYNFTIDESSPIDVEVSLDPELLGIIFENLLAAYDPETSVTARKATGSYYTPKEIVEFIVDNTLLNYLITKTNIKTDLLTSLISYSEEEVRLNDEQKRQIIRAINNLRVIDPAVGSGAFVMGMVHKILHVLNKVDPENKMLDELIDLSNLSEDLKGVSPDYLKKLYVIQNVIHGVDIQPIAIQICNLRFFLSLFTDQHVDWNKPNFGIIPLPNLETKFVAADTLIPLEKPVQGKQLNISLRVPEIQQNKEKLKDLYKLHFHVKNRVQKKNIQNKIQKLKEEMCEVLKKHNWNEVTIKKVLELDIFSPTSTAKWFDPEWIFGVDQGFDIVISNPPYISTKLVPDEYKQELKNYYGFADDLYSHFFFRGIQLLKDGGILGYISSKTFWTIQTKKNLRELLLENRIIQIFDTGKPFENAQVDTCIVIVQKKQPENDNQISFLDGKRDIIHPNVYTVAQSIYVRSPNKVFFIPSDYNMRIYEKFAEKVSTLLNNWWDKISTSKNIEKNRNILEKYRKTLKPGDITILGLITEGGQGLATGDNGKYIGVLCNTKLAEKILKERPEKLLLARDFCKKQNITNKHEAQKFLEKLSEKEIRNLFDSLKEKYDRDIFGQGWLYRIVSPDEIADVDKLTDYEKMNGISGDKTFVPYDKGDKEGNKWYAPTPYYIDWSKKNVTFFKENSGKKEKGMPVIRNMKFYFREGFCWTFTLNEYSEYQKTRIKEPGVYDVNAMSLFPIIDLINSKYITCILNSYIIFYFKRTFINISSAFQINDARQLPIIIPTDSQLQEFENIFNKAYAVQKDKFDGKITEMEAEGKLLKIQKELDELVEKMYLGI